MMSNKLVAEMYELQQKGAKDRTPKDRYRLEQLKLKKSADDARQKELELKARIGEDFLRYTAVNGTRGNEFLEAVVNADDRWYAEMMTATYRDEIEAKKKADDPVETAADTPAEIDNGTQPQ